MSETLVVQSHRGPYEVHFETPWPAVEHRLVDAQSHVLVDANVARLHQGRLAELLARPTTIVIEATEDRKSATGVIPIFEQLVRNGARRSDNLLAIGGGIVQDICCFIASTLFRGLEWRFVPTTLLAQADSCIGSKSSINLGSTKNILGTFHPPGGIVVDASFLDTLETKEMHSGVGEILKVHAIAGAAAFDALARDFDRLFTDRGVLLRYVRAALEIKRRYIEQDEFDRGPRNIFNYGHSFGHAIESATAFGVPHGIAVSMGMDMANTVAAARGIVPEAQARRMRPVLRQNYAAYKTTPIAVDDLLRALQKDKKNVGTMLGLILPVGPDADIQRVQVPADDAFRAECANFLREMSA